MQVSRPSGVNVGVNNQGEIVYVRGNETTDGSIRIIYNAEGDITQIQRRVEGAWDLTQFQVGTSSLFLGPDLKMSTAGNHFQTSRSDDSIPRLYPDLKYDHDLGTYNEFPVAPHLSKLILDFPVNTDDSGEFIGTVFNSPESEFAVPVNALTIRAKVKIGSVAATKPVRYQIWEGSPETGVLLWDVNYPASAFGPAFGLFNEEAIGFVEVRSGTFLSARYSSEATFSLLTNAEVTIEAQVADLYLLEEVQLIEDRQTLSREAGLTLDREGNWVVGRVF